MLARLMAWLREPAPRPLVAGYQPRAGAQPPLPCGGSSAMHPRPMGCTVPLLSEGRQNKGGINDPSRSTVRPPPPTPMRRSIFPHFDAGLPPPSEWMPKTTLNIPMPAGAAPPRHAPCPCCGR